MLGSKVFQILAYCVVCINTYKTSISSDSYDSRYIAFVLDSFLRKFSPSLAAIEKQNVTGILHHFGQRLVRIWLALSGYWWHTHLPLQIFELRFQLLQNIHR